MGTPNKPSRLRISIAALLVLTTIVAIGSYAARHRPSARERVCAFYNGKGLTEKNAFKHPKGYRRCYSFILNEGYINSSFYLAFHNSLSHPLLLPLIEFFDQLELEEIADIIRSVAIVFRDERIQTEGVKVNRLSQFDFGEFVPISRDLDELDLLYFNAKKDLDIPDLVDEYWRRHPEHFK